MKCKSLMRGWKFFLYLFIPFFILILTSFQSCSTLESLGCPYLIDNPHVEIGQKYTYHKYAGAYLTVFNDSKKTIKKYTVSFMLYDSDGNIPFMGTNCVVANCESPIPPYEEETFIVNLDSFIPSVPDEPYLMDYLYLREIIYTDGSSWKDPFGMYAVREAIE
ncbi:MAG: hypothetical protein IKS40_05240 [Treponema sp.]|nr:hypothetical protein [Treponema sp.]